MASGKAEGARRITRRDVVRASMVAGAAAVWSAPVVTRVAAPASAQGSAQPTPPEADERAADEGSAPGVAGPGPDRAEGGGGR
ncbi:MAG TPA: hypothetical protein VIK95_05920 [Egibacteraceae bacterium]